MTKQRPQPMPDLFFGRPVPDKAAKTDKTGRVDVLVRELAALGVDVLARSLGRPDLGAHLNPIIDRFVRANVPSHPVPVTPLGIAEYLGLIPGEAETRRRELRLRRRPQPQRKLRRAS